jgi:predicted SAM-dependent methyltransferase
MDPESAYYVQYGCGLSAPETWTNFDISPTLRLQKIPVLASVARRRVNFPKNVRYGDIVKGLPLAPGSCKAVYCSHVLEHLALDDFKVALRHTFELLRPGGIFRMVLPDLEHHARDYVAALASDEPKPSTKFMRETWMGLERRQRGMEGMLRAWLGNSMHLWMWDYRTLSAELVEAGFTRIRRARFGDSEEPRFKDVEDPTRWDPALGIQCYRPE